MNQPAIAPNRVEQRYNELLNDSSAINEFLHEAPDATPEELSDYLYKVATDEVNEETT